MIVGTLRQNQLNEISQGVTLKTELKVSKKNLEKVSRDLQEHTEHMEDKIKERTHHLEKSKEAVEEMKERVEDALYSTMDPAVVKLLIEKRLCTKSETFSVLFPISKLSRPFLKQASRNRRHAAQPVICSDGNNPLEYKRLSTNNGDCIMAVFGAPNFTPAC